jgi:prepilin-type N-terminal cleavage/methylation domain-containing protein
MNFRPRRSGGFSLIELMFSMAIGSLILILAATLLGTSGDGYERISGSVASDREARAVIAQLSTDLATAVFHKGGVIENSTAAWPADRLGFLSLQPESAQTEAGRIGDLCTVNYYLHDLTLSGKTVRCLMRGFRESNDTFKALREEDTTSLFEQKPNLDEPIAFGVVSFEAHPKLRDREGKWIEWVKNDDVGPEALEIKIVIARRNLTGKLKLPADWKGDSPTGNLLGEAAKADRNKDLQVYATTLRFGNYEKR